jgi:hypothetical protein
MSEVSIADISELSLDEIDYVNGGLNMRHFRMGAGFVLLGSIGLGVATVATGGAAIGLVAAGSVLTAGGAWLATT